MTKKKTASKEQKEAFARARTIALALPGVTERISWGEPNWLVGGKAGKGGKMFAAVGPGHGGPHLAFKAAGGAIEDADDRFVLMSKVFKWNGTQDWFFYFFDFEREDDWEKLKHLIEVSWELHVAALPKKKQDEVMASKPVAKATKGRSAPRARRATASRRSRAPRRK